MYRIRRGERKESEYTHTTAGVVPQVLDHSLESERSSASTLAFPSEPQDWSKYYEQQDLGTSVDIIDTEQTTSLILQKASAMAAEGSDKTPLIFATQTAAMIADLEIEGLNPDESPVSNIGTEVSISSVENRAVLSPQKDANNE